MATKIFSYSRRKEIDLTKSSQKFISRNRPPRVQIEYDVETYESEKKVELPFVMGVMSDLSGASAARLPPVAERKFLEIDMENFDERMKAIRPRVTFSVPDLLADEGQLLIDIHFEQLDDFSPASIATHVEPLARLLEARTHLANLQTYMDGKAGAESLINRLLRDETLLQMFATNSTIDNEKIVATPSPSSTDDIPAFPVVLDRP